MSVDRSSGPGSSLSYQEVRVCPLCLGAGLTPYFPISYLREDSHGFLDAADQPDAINFHLARCEACGFWLTTPRIPPADLQQLYARTNEDYFAPLAEISEARIVTYRRAIGLARDEGVIGGRVLDIGCGTGQALAQWPQAFSRHGVEPSAFAARRAVADAHAHVHVGDLQAATFATGYFDVVTAFDVIEHLDDPLSTFREVGRILRPGGVFVIETGDIGSVNARLAAGHWYYVRLPGHISFFSRRTLAYALRRAGFLGVRLFRLHHGELGVTEVVGHIRALARHLLVRVLGARVLALPIFRSRNLDYSVRYFWDHMLAVAVRNPDSPAEEQRRA